MILWLLACLPDLGERSAAAFDGRCGDCHAAEAAGHAASRHAVSASSDLFVAVRAEAPEPAFCDGCHAPNGPSVGCLDCHAAAGHHGASNGRLMWDWTGPVRGPRGGDAAPHASAEDPFLTDAELCGTCHDVEGEGAFDERPLRHWRRSRAAAAGQGCADCHLSATPGQPSAAVDHRAVGLQADAPTLLRAGLGLEAGTGGLWIENRSGHRLPDGAAWTRELWIAAGSLVVPLHPAIRAGGQATGDPFAADEVVFRGLDVDERRWLPLPPGEACVWTRAVGVEVARRWDQPVPEPVRVACETVR
jgi:hypothetical protein